MVTVTKTVTLEIRELGCGHYAAFPSDRWASVMATGEDIWCPYGDIVSYKETENALAEAQEIANRSRLQEQTALKMLDAERGATKRLLKRVKAGVCPHCHRTFQQLARHMISKHQEAANG